MTDRRATVFGGSGFLGRYVVRHLASQGWIVRVATRHPDEALFLKPAGDVGQIVPVYADVRDEDSVRRAVDGVDAVVNAVGLYLQRGGQTFAAVHEEGARNVARAAKQAGVGGLVHISGIGASNESDSAYVRSRGQGERLVKSAFKDAAILRPSALFGPEDAFFNLIAAMARLIWVLPLFGGGTSKVQPVYVADVAAAAVKALTDPACRGKTYELGGPKVYTYAELMRLVLDVTGRRRLLVPVPFFVAEIKAALLSLTPAPFITRDQVELMKIDTVVGAKAQGFAALGIAPTAAESILPTYLDRFRRGGQWNNPRLA